MFAATGQIPASPRFSGSGLNAALISVHQSASAEPELSRKPESQMAVPGNVRREQVPNHPCAQGVKVTEKVGRKNPAGCR